MEVSYYKAIYFILQLVVCMEVTIFKTNGIAVMSVDLGSEWVKIAIVKPGVPMEVALNKESRRKTPLVVSINGNERLFSDPASTVSIKQPKKAFRYLTHLLGKKFESEAVQKYQQRFPHYNLLKDDKRGTVLFEGEDDKKYSVEELVAMMLNNSRHTAENFAEHPMKDVVLTVPVFFNQAERRALINAANMTGLNVLQLLNDNTAVALNYGIFRAASFNSTVKHVMFYDMGASHTTATIVGYSTTKMKDRGYLETVPQLVVKGIGFDTGLGGLEMDMRLRDHLAKVFKETVKTKGDITKNPRAMAKLLKEAQRVRQVLSANADHKSQVEGLFEEKDFRTVVTRKSLEEMCADLLANVQKPVKMALDAAAMSLSDIGSVILMGGASRIPKVQEILKQAVEKEELEKSINTDEAAALGAVYKAADLIAGFKVKRFIVKDLNLFPVDVSFERTSADSDGSVRIITRNLYHRLNPLPQKKVMTFNKKPQNFAFNITYGDQTFLNDELKRQLDLGTIGNVDLGGVTEAHKANEHLKPKGVKATFHMDESAVLTIEKVEAHFEKSPAQVDEEQQSTFAKLGAKISDFFSSGNKGDATPAKEKPEGEKEPEAGEKKEKEKEDEKEKEKEKKTTEEKEKKEEEPKKTEKEEKKEEEAPKAEESKTNTTSTNDTAPANATEPTKPVTIKEQLTHAIVFNDVEEIDSVEYQASVKLLNDLEAADRAKASRERAMNALESFIFDFRDKMSMEENQGLATEAEGTKIQEALSAASEWLDEDGWDATEEALRKKLSELKTVTVDVEMRMRESQERPQAISQILSSINISEVFLKSHKDIPNAKDIFTEKDITDLEKLSEETKTWLMTTWAKQNGTAGNVKPVLLTSDILSRLGKLDRELVYLMNKVKYYVPPKPKTEEKKKDEKDKSDDKKDDGDDKKADGDAKKAEGDAKKAEGDETAKKDESKKDDAKKDDATKDETTTKDDLPQSTIEDKPKGEEDKEAKKEEEEKKDGTEDKAAETLEIPALGETGTDDTKTTEAQSPDATAPATGAEKPAVDATAEKPSADEKTKQTDMPKPTDAPKTQKEPKTHEPGEL